MVHEFTERLFGGGGVNKTKILRKGPERAAEQGEKRPFTAERA